MCLYVYLFVYLFVCLFICLFVYSFICLFVRLFVYLFVCLFVYLFVCLFVFLFRVRQGTVHVLLGHGGAYLTGLGVPWENLTAWESYRPGEDHFHEAGSVDFGCAPIGRLPEYSPHTVFHWAKNTVLHSTAKPTGW